MKSGREQEQKYFFLYSFYNLFNYRVYSYISIQMIVFIEIPKDIAFCATQMNKIYPVAKWHLKIYFRVGLNIYIALHYFVL